MNRKTTITVVVTAVVVLMAADRLRQLPVVKQLPTF